MAGGLSDREEAFLHAAQEQNLLTSGRASMLRHEKFFYPDVSIGELAVSKCYLDAAQVEAIKRLLDGAPTAPAAAAAPAPPAPKPSPAAVSRAAMPQAPPVRPTPAAPPAPSPAPAPVRAPARPAEPSPPPTIRPDETDRIRDVAVASFTRLEQYLSYARARQASDLHLSAGYPPFLRRFGRFTFFDRPPLKDGEVEALVFEALDEPQRTVLRERLNLECSLELQGQGRYRTTMIRHQQGWEGVFRVVSARIPTIQELGLPESVLRLADYRQGMILITGPSGCGKTTTMAAMVDYVNAHRAEHILTLEQPIEYTLEPRQAQVNQRQIGLHSESYARALRAALREDPDVVLLGEMRDLETISMAITAAETGHLIFGTLHTTTAPRTITRILDSYPPSQQPQIRTMMSESLRGIICQQLIPRCDREGVALACEVLIVTPGVASLIREMKIHQVGSAMQTGKRQGMVRMEDTLMELYQQGAITIEEACERADDKRTFLPLMPR